MLAERLQLFSNYLDVIFFDRLNGEIGVVVNAFESELILLDLLA